MDPPTSFDIRKILEFLPHRYPFLLVDRVNEIVDGEYIKAHKCVSFNEPFFQGHFPGNPVMPGVLQIEAMAQTAGAIVRAAEENYAETTKSVLFMSIDGVKFRKPVKPGDQLRMHVEKIKERRNIFVFKGQTTVDGQVVSEAEFTAMIIG